MSTCSRTALGTALGTLLVVATLGVAGAAEPLELRWIPIGTPTGLSGVPYDPAYSLHVRINSTLSTKTTDRYYAIRGVTYASNGALSVVPAFLHPDANRSIPIAWYLKNDHPNEKTAELPDGYFLTSLQICDNGKAEGARDLAGIRVWGHRLDALGRTIEPTGPVESKRSSCNAWKQKISCPSGTIAHSLRYHHSAAIALVCAAVQPAVGPWNPWSGQVLDGGYFKDATGKIHVKLRTANDSHTTGNVEFAEIKLMAGGVAVCQDKYSSGPAIPGHDHKDVDIGMPCTWAQIKQAGGAACKLGDSCAVKLKGVIKARVEGLLEEHPYETSVSLKHIP